MAALEVIVLSFVLTNERTLQLLLASLCLVAALLVAAAVIALVNRWRRQRDIQEDVSPNTQLAHFRSLYEAGTISQEEFERLRAVLSARMREELGVSKPTEAASPPTGETPVPPPERTGETPVPPPERTGETPVPPPERTGETPVPPPERTGVSPVAPPETGIQRPDGLDSGIRPA